MTFSSDPPPSVTGTRSDERLTTTPTKVLLVDDDRVFARSLARSLRGLGIAIEVSNDGAEAMQLLETKHYDALLLDLEMHPVDGWQVLSFHSKLKEPPPVVVLSGHLDVPRTVRALRAGVTDAYQKPVDPLELTRGLKDAIVKCSGDSGLAPPDTEDTLDAASQIIGHAPSVQVIRSQIRRVARYRDLPVLIVGEAGCEQEQVARVIHALDGNEGPFERVDCSELDSEELSRELFGMAAGVLAGGAGAPGVFERSHGGTLFLDNVSEISPALQARLLHVLETRRYRRVGSNEDRIFHARVVSATRRSIQEGRIPGMRPDLYYRLAGITVVLPPLRTRMEDIAPLVEHYVRQLTVPGCDPKRFSARALSALHGHGWPGNLRELELVIEFALKHSKGERVGTRPVRRAVQRIAGAGSRSSRPPRLAARSPTESRHDSSLPTVERALIIDAFGAAKHNISEAARQLGIPRSTLRDRLKRLGLL